MSADRTNCCAAERKPCTYHEGYADALGELSPLAQIVVALREVYDDRGAVIWLIAEQTSWPMDHAYPELAAWRNRQKLNFCALDLIQLGRSQEVADAIERLQSGATS